MSVDLTILPTRSGPLCAKDVIDALSKDCELARSISKELPKFDLIDLKRNAKIDANGILEKTAVYGFEDARLKSIHFYICESEESAIKAVFAGLGNTIPPESRSSIMKAMTEAGYEIVVLCFASRTHVEANILPLVVADIAQCCNGYIYIDEGEFFTSGAGIFTGELFRQTKSRFTGMGPFQMTIDEDANVSILPKPVLRIPSSRGGTGDEEAAEEKVE
ncbi:MAG: hypothetical protein HS116_00640 [Planctomycetes bacterium]|nr:hypothetical protein [Planctomycetota bacterium]